MLTIKNVLEKFDDEYSKLFSDITGYKCSDKNGRISREKVVDLMYGEGFDKLKQFLQDNLTLMLESIEKELPKEKNIYNKKSSEFEGNYGFNSCLNQVKDIINSHR